MLGPLHGEVYVHGTVDCLLQVNSKANPREPLWTEFQTFTFYSLVLPSFRSLFISLSGWHSAETWVACACAGGSCGSGESGGLVSLVACVGHPAGTVHLPSTTAAFWLRFKRPLLHWLSLSSDLSQMFKLEDSKICPQGGCMQILWVTNRFEIFEGEIVSITREQYSARHGFWFQFSRIFMIFEAAALKCTAV